MPPVSTPEPQPEKQTYIYNHDPENYCTITFDGKSIIVKGKMGSEFSGVKEQYPPMNIERTVDGDTLTCVLTPTVRRFSQSTGRFYMVNANGRTSTINLELSNSDGISLPDMSSYAAANQRVVDSVTNVSPSRIASYITLDGKLGDKAEKIWEEITKISNEICEGIDSDYEKLRAISRWVSDNIYYDHPIYSSGAPQYCLSLEYMLNNRSSICGGYATMTSALCAVQVIRCLNISGMAVIGGKCYPQGAEGGFHEWNIAEIDGRQIIVDSGWNSGNSLGYDGTYSTGKQIFRYFDIGAEIFALDHKAQSAEYRDYLSLFE
ncbi:MAG: transglutaminase-like domain-containing protein [Oscillospiraceae bacterium]|nr:transglutaminase-like domain-containing protein [Oscillospiraceae bacterium]